MRFNPFRALRPRPELAAKVAAVPYDVVNRAEAASLARGNRHSFLHVCRSDIDLPAETDPHDAAVYAAARAALDRCVAEGTLLHDAEPAVFVYRQEVEGRTQTGIVGCVHVDDYECDVIRKHEKTRKDKEDDRTRHVLALGANAEPVFLTYKGADEIAVQMARDAAAPPVYDFVAEDGVRHTVWRASDPAAYVAAFARVPVAYVADGHHRSASAWRAGKERRNANPEHRGDEEYNWFLAVLFPAAELKILPYNRVVRDLWRQSADEVLAQLRRVGTLEQTRTPLAPAAGSFCIYLAGHWYRLTLDPGSIDRSDPVASLDVALLQDRILGPILGIGDPRSDPRIDFVGGSRGTRELERRVDSKEAAIGFSLRPTTVAQLLAVADAGAIMPPKSTWFEPKLRSGLFVHTLD